LKLFHIPVNTNSIILVGIALLIVAAWFLMRRR